VTKVDRGPSHVLDGAAAIRPVRVHVAVTAQRREQRQGSVRNRRGLRFEALQVRGFRARQRFRDNSRGDRADPRQPVQCAAPAPCLELRIRQCANDVGRVAKGTHAI
jgi:hypothetical protein